MKVRYHTVNVDLPPQSREFLQAELGRVEDALRHFSDPIAHVEVEQSPRKGGFGVSIHVDLPTKSLFASHWGGDLRSAAEKVVDKLERQARRHLDRLRKDERAGAETHRNAVPAAAIEPEDLEAARDLEDFTDRISTHVARLHQVLRRELALDPRAEKAGGAVSVPDIVEEALLYVFEHFREKPARMSPDRWLVRRGLLFLDEELDRAVRTTPDTDMPEEEPEEPEVWEDLMDIPVFEPSPLDRQAASRSQASPEVLQDRAAMRRATAAALKSLPDRQRKALTLHYLENYDPAEIAYVLNSSEEKVERWLAEGRSSLRAALAEWGG